MSTTTKPRHRPTPTQVLRDRITELEAAIANTPSVTQVKEAHAETTRLDGAVQVLAEQMSTVTEHAFVIQGHPAGDLIRILCRRRGLTDRWAVVDDTLGSHRFWAGLAWYRTSGAPRDVVYRWSEQEARRLARLLSGQDPLPGDEADAEYQAAVAVLLPEPLSAEDEALVDAHLADVGEQLTAMVERAFPSEVVEGQLQAAIATIGARHAKPASEAAEVAQGLETEHDPEETITVAAPIDVPGYQPEPPDAPQQERLLSLMAQGISANSEQATVALPLARVQGPAETQQMPVLHVEPIPPVPLPPLPEHPPLTEPLPPITWRGGNVRPLSDTVPVQFAKAGAK